MDKEEFEASAKLKLEDAFQLVYQQIKRIASRQKIRFSSLDTMNTTAIVHEAYVKLEKRQYPEFESKTHFYRVAAKVIRHLLINYTEYKMAGKRGGGTKNEDWAAWEDKISLTDGSMEKLLSLEEALKELKGFSPRQHQLVEARFFGGLTIEETAELMGISPATAKRDWALAKSWLYKRLKES